MNDCNHDYVVVVLDFRKDITSVRCGDCGYIFSVPEFKARKFKNVLVKE